ncbi:MAG: hypothetical protein GX221_09120 [Candidatus Riflebacteria bacterium]|nr:hypothetical protein [Candidatus Riflebacteria bacterium]
MPFSTFFKQKSAVSLLEVLIAAVIIALTFIPIMRLVDFGSVSTVKQGNYARATRLAQELIEECKSVPFKLYEEKYRELGSEGKNEEDLSNTDFFPKTQENIQKFVDEEGKKGNLKQFKLKAKIKGIRNELNQLAEIWFFVEMNWVDKGDLESASEEQKRTVKVGSAYHNAEII